jgi:adenylate cyclase
LGDKPTEAAAKGPPPSEFGTIAPASLTAPVAHATLGAEASWWGSVWRRIKEHKIAEWTIAYVAFAFVALHGATLLSDALEWPHVIVRVVTFVLILGLPIVPILAWYHGVRALKRVSGSELIIIALLLAIGGSLLWLFPHPTAERARTETPSPPATINPRPPSSAEIFAPPPHSIAVLPFVNMSGDAKQDYFADGVSEELLNALSRLNDLQVVARTSSFSFKGKDVDISTIAHKLNVGAVLEGSVRRAGNTVRITAQLINTVSGFHLWSETYDRPFSDILSVQTEVATAVAKELQAKMLGDESAKLEIGGTKNPGAYDAYLRADREIRDPPNSRATFDSRRRAALAALDQAIKLDPRYAAAYAQRSGVLEVMSINTSSEHDNLAKQALASAERAVALAPDYGEAHAALARILSVLYFDFGGAESEYERALALAPGSAEVQWLFASFAAKMGHVEPALAATRRVASLDPQNYSSYLRQVGDLSLLRRFDEAQVALQHARALKPELVGLDLEQARIFLASGQAEQARQLCESLETPTEENFRHYCLVLAYHALGKQADAKSELERYKALKGEGDDAAFDYAQIYAQLGDKAQALQWLSKAERVHDSGMTYLKVYWQLDPIRDEPQFKAIEARMKFPP